MTAGALARWPDRIEQALVVTSAGSGPGKLDPRVQNLTGAHPIPDARSVAAAEEALRRAASLGPRDLLVALISGGASALLAAPPAGLDLAEKQALVAALLERGVPIREVNLVRRHLSRVKGGRLGHAAGGARVLTLVVSDVIGGEPHDVGSGPTVPDPTTVEEARALLARAGLPEPPGMSESVKPGALRARSRILADPPALAHAVAEALRRRGLEAVVDPPDEGDAASVAARRAARAATLAPGEAVVVACEPTLHLPEVRGEAGAPAGSRSPPWPGSRPTPPCSAPPPTASTGAPGTPARWSPATTRIGPAPRRSRPPWPGSTTPRCTPRSGPTCPAGRPGTT